MLPEEALEIIKRALVQNGKKLTEVYTKVLPLILKNYSYNQIAPKVGYQYSYVKDVGAEICKSLSEEFGFTVRKLKLLPSVERYAQQEQMRNTLTSSQPNQVDWGEADDLPN